MSTLRDLKKALKSSLEMEEELYEFCIECLQKIYGEDSKQAVYLFEEAYEGFDHCGCLQGLRYIENHMKKKEVKE